jgi:hypothetical protein
MAHTVTSDTGTMLSSGSMAKGDTYSMTFDEAGTFDYHCEFHSGMAGKVIVTEQNKKQKEIKAKSKITEVKNIQVKIGTGEHDLELKAKKTSEWLGEGHRVKIDLFLPGRAKHFDQAFLKERLERMLRLLTEDYKIADEAKKSPKGLSIIIEKASAKAVKKIENQEGQ